MKYKIETQTKYISDDGIVFDSEKQVKDYCDHKSNIQFILGDLIQKLNNFYITHEYDVITEDMKIPKLNDGGIYLLLNTLDEYQSLISEYKIKPSSTSSNTSTEDKQSSTSNEPIPKYDDIIKKLSPIKTRSVIKNADSLIYKVLNYIKCNYKPNAAKLDNIVSYFSKSLYEYKPSSIKAAVSVLASRDYIKKVDDTYEFVSHYGYKYPQVLPDDKYIKLVLYYVNHCNKNYEFISTSKIRNRIDGDDIGIEIGNTTILHILRILEYNKIIERFNHRKWVYKKPEPANDMEF